MSKNNISVPEAKAALDQFKMQAASEVGVTLNQNGYNGNLTSKQAGSIGGQMVNLVCPVRQLKIDRINRRALRHLNTITYQYFITI
ncbi:MAG: alpha/beta-type small acid-soluble spore protein [Ruminococcaceae bacterium]|nr:alpha/beta-type small acid-soluble spore protein [Oscillospiraceae bacterium]